MLKYSKSSIADGAVAKLSNLGISRFVVTFQVLPGPTLREFSLDPWWVGTGRGWGVLHMYRPSAPTPPSLEIPFFRGFSSLTPYGGSPPDRPRPNFDPRPRAVTWTPT